MFCESAARIRRKRRKWQLRMSTAVPQRNALLHRDAIILGSRETKLFLIYVLAGAKVLSRSWCTCLRKKRNAKRANRSTSSTSSTRILQKEPCNSTVDVVVYRNVTLETQTLTLPNPIFFITTAHIMDISKSNSETRDQYPAIDVYVRSLTFRDTTSSIEGYSETNDYDYH